MDVIQCRLFLEELMGCRDEVVLVNEFRGAILRGAFWGDARTTWAQEHQVDDQMSALLLCRSKF
jgi:hypothetical protein